MAVGGAESLLSLTIGLVSRAGKKATASLAITEPMALSARSDRSRLIELIYAAAVNADGWPPFLAALSEATGSEVGCVLLHDTQSHAGSSLWQHGSTPELMAEYDCWAPKNVYMLAAAPAVRTGVIVNAEDFVSDRHVVDSEYFNEYLRRVGVMHNLGAGVFYEESVVCGLMLLRQIGRRSHSSRDIALVRGLLPHLQRAIEIHRRLASADLLSGAAGEALDRMPIGVLLIGTTGRVSYMNRAALDLTGGDGLNVSAQGRLSAERSTESRRLGLAVSEACATGLSRDDRTGAALRVSRGSGKRPLSVLVAPLSIDTLSVVSGRPAAIVFVADPDRSVAGVEDLFRDLYSLTPTESTVATMLADGRRVDDICDLLKVSQNTARTHVKRILEKTRARGQGDLIRMLISGPGGLLRHPRMPSPGRSND